MSCSSSPFFPEVSKDTLSAETEVQESESIEVSEGILIPFDSLTYFDEAWIYEASSKVRLVQWSLTQANNERNIKFDFGSQFTVEIYGSVVRIGDKKKVLGCRGLIVYL
jgi:hypothetical protein